MMDCPDCGRTMTMLFTGVVCDYCDPPTEAVPEPVDPEVTEEYAIDFGEQWRFDDDGSTAFITTSPVNRQRRRT